MLNNKKVNNCLLIMFTEVKESKSYMSIGTICQYAVRKIYRNMLI